jgi:hypothetical protein
MKHQKRIPNATLTFSNLESTLTWWTSSSKTSYKKDGEKEPKLKKTPKILMASRGQKKLIGKANPWGKLEGAQVEHLWTQMTNPTKTN